MEIEGMAKRLFNILRKSGIEVSQGKCRDIIGELTKSNYKRVSPPCENIRKRVVLTSHELRYRV